MGIAHKFFEAVISAVENVGEDGAGKDGIVGYLMEGVELKPGCHCRNVGRCFALSEPFR